MEFPCKCCADEKQIGLVLEVFGYRQRIRAFDRHNNWRLQKQSSNGFKQLSGRRKYHGIIGTEESIRERHSGADMHSRGQPKFCTEKY